MGLRRSRKRDEYVSADDARAEVLADPFAQASQYDLERRHEWIALLRRIRESLRYTQADVAGRMRSTQPTVSEFEAAEADPQLSTLQKYCRAVDHRLELVFVPDSGLSPAGSSALAAGQVRVLPDTDWLTASGATDTGLVGRHSMTFTFDSVLRGAQSALAVGDSADEVMV